MNDSQDVEAEDEFNRFMRSHRVISTREEYNAAGGYWSVIVRYYRDAGFDGGSRDGSSSRKSRTDYREVLSPADFDIYNQLRQWRLREAEAADVAVYRVLNNDQLADIVRLRPKNRAELLKVPGISDARADAYGESLLVCLSEILKADQIERGREQDEGLAPENGPDTQREDHRP